MTEIDRRKFLLGAAATAAACKATTPLDSDVPAVPAPEREPGPDPYVPELGEDIAMFPWSIAVGDPTPDGVVFIVRANAPSVEVVFAQFVEGAWSEAGRLVNRPTESATHRAELSGLSPDTPYAIWAELDGARSRVTHFRTAPADDTWRQVRLIATSCLGNAGDLSNLAHMAGFDPDAILLLGDTIYADGSLTGADYYQRWDAHLEREPICDMFGAGAVIATWDDHEIANNWVLSGADSFQTEITPQQLEVGTEVWRDVVPMRLGPEGSQVWRSMKFGEGFEIFVLDCRGERTDGQIVSEAQLAWLIEGLEASDATFKIVLTSVHLTDHFELIGVVQDVDRWQGYPDQRAALIAAARAIPGTVFITGDMHYGAVQRLDPAGGPGEALVEIAAGPAGSTIFPAADIGAVGDGEVPAQYETLVQDWTFCVIDLDPGLGTVEVAFVDDAGETVASQSLTEA